MHKLLHKNTLRSLIVTPLLVTTISFGSTSFGRIPTLAFLNQGQVNNTLLSVDSAYEKELTLRAQKIDAYFRERNMPLEGFGAKMVEVAEENDIDWTLIPAIAVRESTGGKNACKQVKNNPFGWGSCKIGFKSMDEAIETIGKNLGGNNPKTAVHYDEKEVKEILQSYNPPSVVPLYADQVMKIMDRIENQEV